MSEEGFPAKWLFYPIIVLAVLIIVSAALMEFSFREKVSLAAAFIIASLNYFAGVAAFSYGLKKSRDVFIKSVLGAIVLRLLISLTLVLISLIFLELSLNSFIFSIFIFYSFYLILEIIFLNRKKL